MLNNLNSNFKTRLSKLNKKQLEAVQEIWGPVLVVAGPGSGKTEILSMRIANILTEVDVSPSSILCLTFTDNAAINMRERLELIIGESAHKVKIHTFHSFASSIINKYPEYFYEGVDFEPAGDLEIKDLITEIFEKINYSNKLKSYHPEKGHTYLSSMVDLISLIKKLGLTANEYQERVLALINEAKDVQDIINKNWPHGERLSLKKLDFIKTILEELDELNTESSVFYKREFVNAFELAYKNDTVTAISKDLMDKIAVKIKDEKGLNSYVLNDLENKEKLISSCEIYKLYEEAKYKKGIFDFDDMILNVLQVVKSNNKLRGLIRENIEFVLVDEFQDTSEVQMKLINEILNTEDIEIGNLGPNIFAVGDDDQSIYKFQGAEIDNIINFKNAYTNVKVIVLDTNYRSAEIIIEKGKEIINKAQVRLETKFKEIVKLAKQGNLERGAGEFNIVKFDSDEEEYRNIAKEIANILSTNKDATIGVLATKHKPLGRFAKYLNEVNINFKYVKKSNVFELLPIKEMFDCFIFANSLINTESSNGISVREDLIPKILLHKYWNLDREIIFDLVLQIKQNRTSWLELLKNDIRLKSVYSNILAIIENSLELDAEHIIHNFVENSGLKEYYWSDEVMRSDSYSYINYLRALHTLFDVVREEKKEGDFISLNDLILLEEKYRKNNIQLTIKEGTFNESNVELMTVFSSKGLEFDYVFLIDANDESWTKSKNSSNVPKPNVLKKMLTKNAEDDDDYIRLLFVAITRAKTKLNISYTTNRIRFFGVDEVKIKKEKDFELSADLQLIASPYTKQETNILSNLVKNYKMSVTHFNNYLNVKEGGPIYFLKQNLLSFPQPMTNPSVYGSAIHSSIEEMINYKKWNGGEAASIDHILSVFRKGLVKGGISKKDLEIEYSKGEKVLTNFYKKEYPKYTGNEGVEVDLRDEGIVIDGVELTGKLDFVRIENNQIEVLDFKTGKALKDWDKGQEYEKVKAHHYKNQLMMYKLMLENSSTYSKLEIKDLSLQFVDDEDIETMSLEFNEEEYERFKKLVYVVFNEIKKANFILPEEFIGDKLKDIIAFEDYLLER